MCICVYVVCLCIPLTFIRIPLVSRFSSFHSRKTEKKANEYYHNESSLSFSFFCFISLERAKFLQHKRYTSEKVYSNIYL